MAARICHSTLQLIGYKNHPELHVPESPHPLMHCQLTLSRLSRVSSGPRDYAWIYPIMPRLCHAGPALFMHAMQENDSYILVAMQPLLIYSD